MLYHLKIEEFEVAGVALNGTITGILSDLFIKNNKHKKITVSTAISMKEKDIVNTIFFVRSFIF